MRNENHLLTLFLLFLLRHFSLNRSLGEFRQRASKQASKQARESKLNLHDTLLNTDLFLIAWLHDCEMYLCSLLSNRITKWNFNNSHNMQYNCLWELLKVTEFCCAMNHAKFSKKFFQPNHREDHKLSDFDIHQFHFVVSKREKSSNSSSDHVVSLCMWIWSAHFSWLLACVVH